jgi:hypothetical protein
MKSQFSFNVHENRMTAEFPVIVTEVWLGKRSGVYQYSLLEYRIETELANFFMAKGIRVKRYKPPEAGAGGGGDVLEWLLNFYHAHKILIALAGKLPLFFKGVKSSVSWARNWYVSRLIEEDVSEIGIILHAYIDAADMDNTARHEIILFATKELYNLLPEVDKYLKNKHGEFNFCYSLKVRVQGSIYAVRISNYRGEKFLFARILTKISKTKGSKDTIDCYIYKHPLFRYKKYKIEQNVPIL